MKIAAKHRGSSFLILALLAFGGLGLELLLVVLEPVLFGKDFADYTTLESVLHWSLTCLVWAAVAFALLRSSQKLSLNPFSQKDQITAGRWLAAALLLAVSTAVSIWDWNGIKIIKEFAYNGLLKFIFQYIYYIFETVLVLLIIIFGQQAGELWFKSKNVPWGGILVALTWGLVHSFTKGDLLVGLIACFGGLLYGTAYLVVKRNIFIAYPLIFLMFIV
jgi:hypothetical protein